VHALKRVQFGRAVDLMGFNTSVNRAIRPRDFFYANIVTSRGDDARAINNSAIIRSSPDFDIREPILAGTLNFIGILSLARSRSQELDSRKIVLLCKRTFCIYVSNLRASTAVFKMQVCIYLSRKTFYERI